MADWKRPVFIGIGWGLGTAVGLVLLVGGFLWYQSRPMPPKPWNTGAIVCSEPPSFDSGNNYTNIRFRYFVKNTTGSDYQIASEAEIKVMGRSEDGTLSQPLPTEVRHLEVPIFVPANQKGTLSFTLVLRGIPEHKTSETDEQYHERLRAFCEDKIGGAANFVLFDEANRYQINLPRWAAEPPKKNP